MAQDVIRVYKNETRTPLTKIEAITTENIVKFDFFIENILNKQIIKFNLILPKNVTLISSLPEILEPKVLYMIIIEFDSKKSIKGNIIIDPEITIIK